MKHFSLILSVFGMLFLCSCATQNYIEPKILTELIQKNEFTFMAKRANPMDYSAVNTVTSSIPGAIPTRILELDYGYSLELSKDFLSVHLPYFGRAYRASYDSQNTGFYFGTKDFKVIQNQDNKNTNVYQIFVNDQPNIQKIILEIFSNGRAILSINANDRQPISYDGYIMKNEEVKK